MMVVFISSFSSDAFAISITDPGVVGAYRGKLDDSSLANETALAQFLLDMYAIRSDSNGPDGWS